MAESAVSFVLDQLSILLRDEAKLLGGLRQDVQLISYELGHMRSFLRVAEAKEDDDPRLKEWVKQVREAAYDTEDILDEFVLKFARHRADGLYGCFQRIFSSIKNLRTRHRIASEIRSIKSRVANISEARQRYQSDYGTSDQVPSSVAANDAWRYNRDDALFEEEAKLVGIEEPKQQLVSLLLDGGDSQLKVISVVGMGGLGKTTLVKKVHEHIDVRRQFQAHAWITVSQTINFPEILKDLIRQLHEEIKEPVPSEVESMKEEVRLKSFIRGFLREKRYAIVFDDVWDMNFWNYIKFALPEGNCGNRVMITTRIAVVASASVAESDGHVYWMKPLTFEQSWTLFCRKAFGGQGCPEYLMDVSKSILGKCEGLPLAIVVISGFLALKDKSSASEWEIVRRSLGAELEEGGGLLDRIKKIISLSINDLPYHLKTCLMYLSVFPEDYEIRCSRLIYLWVAEGFVQRREGMTMEERGWAYLKELVNRSLVQVVDSVSVGRPFFIRFIRIHDLLRELILSKSSEENTAIFAATGQYTRWPEKVPRLAIGNFTTEEITRREGNPFVHLRSLISFGWSVEPLSKSLGILCHDSRLLRVLDLQGAPLEEIPDEVYKLFHLKYLNLAGTRVKSISKSIGKLQNLVFLDLYNTQVTKLPVEILKLLRLRRLVVGRDKDFIRRVAEGVKVPHKMGDLVSLHSLFDIVADSDGIVVKEIEKLTELRALGITKLKREQGKELWSSLQKLAKLESLYVVSFKDKDDGFETIDMDYPVITSSSTLQFLERLFLVGRLERVPQWVASRQGLAVVTFMWTELTDDPLEILQHLPNLTALSLMEAYQGESFCFKAGGFPKLKILYLAAHRRLKRITIQIDALPRLQELALLDLDLLEDLPLGIQHLTPHLQGLYVADASEILTAKFRKIDEQQSKEYTKIAHILDAGVSYLTQDGRRQCHKL